ncbi:MAG: succinylglutamate desuccinylase [Alphaproteobacteria bacterium]|nr:succinylglutamate desuccinylase [Alphaproteobacteria bacterium]
MTDAFEFPALDLQAHRQGNTGIAYAHRLVAEIPGPTTLITALTHGNELCGAYALDRFLRQGFRPVRGTLLLCIVNVDAYGRFDPASPCNSRFVDEDLNRLWSPAILDSERQSVELARARAIRPLVEEADFLLDLHSMQSECPALTLCGVLPRSLDLALRVGGPRHLVVDAGHRAGPRMRDHGGFADPVSHKTALLVECGRHGSLSSVAVAHEVSRRFLAAVGMTDAAVAPCRDPLVIDVVQAVTVESERFRFAESYRGLECIAKAGTLIAHDGERAVRTPHDECVLIMPGRDLKPGQTAVRLGRYRR